MFDAHNDIFIRLNGNFKAGARSRQSAVRESPPEARERNPMVQGGLRQRAG
jgi:hypothetical protein